MRGSRLFTAHAIVIKRKNVGEADRMITMFSKEHGKLRVLARGVRKVSSKRGPHIEVFSNIIATVHNGQQATLTEVAPVSSHEAIRKDLSRVSAAYYLCELIDGLLPIEQPHEDVFMLLNDAFDSLSRVKQERIDILRARFAAALLTKLGYMQAGKKYKDNDIDGYVEELLEHRLKTVRISTQIT